MNPIPENYPRVTPCLGIDGAAAAIDFYCDVLGATVRGRMEGPDGKIGHAETRCGAGSLSRPLDGEGRSLQPAHPRVPGQRPRPDHDAHTARRSSPRRLSGSTTCTVGRLAYRGGMPLKPGDKAPGFTLLDQSGEKVRLSGFKGRKALVCFYPKNAL